MITDYLLLQFMIDMSETRIRILIIMKYINQSLVHCQNHGREKIETNPMKPGTCLNATRTQEEAYASCHTL